ncbi:MAG: PAS domain S-box protein [Desulfobacterales bacterium]|nr:MAG: PAS domain S-box protein [Desulfobacterales bacterium]
MPSIKRKYGAAPPAASSRRGETADPKLKADEARIQKDRYRVLIEDVADGFYETDLRGNFKFFNDALSRIFGYDRGAIQDHNFREFMDEKNAQIAYDAFNGIYRTGQGLVDIYWEIIRKDGETRHLEISANLIRDDEGRKVGFRGIARDVTERFLSQRALRESEQCALELSRNSRRAEQRYRAFLEFLPDPVFVFNLDSTVSYLNPAFEKVFGWTLAELEGKIIPFVPDSQKEETRIGIQRLFQDKVIHGFETKRLTKDGRILDILIDGAIFYDMDNAPAGQVVTLRDITREKRHARINQALFRIAKALYRYRGLDARLKFITKEVQDLMAVEGALVILLDEEKKEFFFREAIFNDSEAVQKIKEICFPADKGVAGHVYRTGEPTIVADTSQNPYFFRQVDEQAGIQTRNMLDVPLQSRGRMIGVLGAVNKKEGAFDQADVDLLSMIANIVALPIENASILEELQRSYEEVQSLNRAKDRVIHHLSHELKTPVSVLAASLSVLSKKLAARDDTGWQTILERAQRNLQRILAMQYQIEDMLRERDYTTYPLLATLLDVCTDVLEALAAEESGEKDIVSRIRQRVEELFGPREAIPQAISLGPYVAQQIQELRPRFAHRKVNLETQIASTSAVWVPADVLTKIVEGLVRNAVENTPDGGLIVVTVRPGKTGPEFEVKDTGVGISAENQRLFFENYFTAYEPLHYSSRKPYEFLAGGKGFDLLRMKIFSERYHFKIEMVSQRCDAMARDAGTCVGKIEACALVQNVVECRDSGGTTVTVKFNPVGGVGGHDRENEQF